MFFLVFLGFLDHLFSKNCYSNHIDSFFYIYLQHMVSLWFFHTICIILKYYYLISILGIYLVNFAESISISTCCWLTGTSHIENIVNIPIVDAIANKQRVFNVFDIILIPYFYFFYIVIIYIYINSVWFNQEFLIFLNYIIICISLYKRYVLYLIQFIQVHIRRSLRIYNS